MKAKDLGGIGADQFHEFIDGYFAGMHALTKEQLNPVFDGRVPVGYLRKIIFAH
jgi:hypothetical protein